MADKVQASWAATAAEAHQFPDWRLPEIAFVGRSNVGKSSLLNRLAGSRSLARTSRTPGKTRLIHFYRLARASKECAFVDLPGYGYAKVSQAERRRWKTLIETYLVERVRLRGVVLLQDVRRDFSQDESDLLAWLAEHSLRCQIVVTKIDKLPPMQRARRLRALEMQIGAPEVALIATSVARGIGIEELWRALSSWLQRDAG